MSLQKEKTIIIVEEREETRTAIKEAFIEKNVKWIEIDKAAEAVMSVMTELPDLVILSLEMPDGDGVQLLHNMRIMNNEVPIITLVGVPTKEKVLEGRSARILDMVVKPPDMERLLGKAVETLWPECEDDVSCLFEDEREPFIEAIPKGAEVLNINDTIAGMKVARTLVFNEVVFADKGNVLSEAQLKQLNRMGVSEICVYISPELKKLAAERKKRMLQQKSIKAAEQSTDRKGGKVFSTVKREAVRIPTDITAKVIFKDIEDNDVEIECKVVDISAGGCAILTAAKLAKDLQIYLTFMLDGMEIKGVRGVVRDCGTRGAKPPFMSFRSGIYFDSITERFREEMITKLFKVQRDMKKKGIPTYVE